MAISGSTAVVGAPGKNSNTGAAYVFTRSGSTWSQRAELTAADGAAGDQFGGSVALYGSTAVVGAPGKNSNAGVAYVFTGSGGTWSQRSELFASDAMAYEEFGSSVAVSGSTAVVGAYGRNSFGHPYGGAAYVFTGSGGTWSQQAELTAIDGTTNGEFGYSVAVYGSTALVGALDNLSGSGAAYVFTSSGGTWSQEAELTAADSAPGDRFALVALSGSTALVGAPAKNTGTGAAYVFVLPSQQAKLTAADAAANDRFGVSVAVSGSTAVVGAYGKNTGAGAAYVFTRSGSTWTQRAKLTATGVAAGDYFGYSVAVSGSTVVVGAPATSPNTGAAYVFTGSGSTWTQRAKLTATGGAPGDRFGYAVALSGSVAVIGATGSNSNTGAAYVFTGSGSTWTQQAKLTAADAATGDHFGASVAISGSTAVAGANGKNTATGAAYVFAGV